MKDQIKSEAKDLLHELDKKLDELSKSKEKDHSKKINQDAKGILNILDHKLTAMSGGIDSLSYDLLSVLLKGAHKKVDSLLESGEIGIKTAAKHKLYNSIARGVIDFV